MSFPTSYLSTRGYGFVKSENTDLIEELREKLSVKPYTNPNSPNAGRMSTFPVYCESSNKIYIPRSYGLKHFGLPDVDQLKDGDDALNLVFTGSLREEQREPVSLFIDAAADPKRRGGIISLACGGGKCLARNTPILMYDGTIRPVQDIRVGDRIMGDDSTPRTVLSTCIGIEEMVTIIPKMGDPYTTNMSHMLSLRCPKNPSKIVNMPVKEYISIINAFPGITNMLCGYRVGVEFEEKHISLDPYYTGRWFADHGKEILYAYRCNTRSIRKSVLAGIIDSRGNYSFYHKGFIIEPMQNDFVDGVLYIARSLGLAAYKERSPGSLMFMVIIYGNGIEEIPTRIPNKIAPKYSYEWDPLVVPIAPVQSGIGMYYGFELDGNRRFLLGDFTVTHNTVCSMYIACQLKKKTMVVCHKEFLMNQWRERIEQFIPSASVGIIKQNKIKTDGCDIVLASLQSLAMRDYPSLIFKGFHLAIIDEIHHTSAEVFSRALPKISFPVMLGLSATLKRADGLSKVFEWYVGKPVYISKRKSSSVRVYMLPFEDQSEDYSNEIRLWGGRLNVAQMINNITSYDPRNMFIIDVLKSLLKREPFRKTLILSDRRAHLAELERIIVKKKIGTVGYYVGGMKENDLKESESKDIILGTFTMACIADDTIMIDPISGKERYIREFVNHVGYMPDGDHKHPIPLISMYPSTETIHVSHCANFGYTQQKPCVTIVHELGDITTSKDHRFYTLNGWKMAGELTTSDYLITPQRLDIKSVDIDYISIPDMWMIGCIMGEMNGSICDEKDVMYLINHILDTSSSARELISFYRTQLVMHKESFLGMDLMFLPEEKITSFVGGLFDGAGRTDNNCLYFVLDSVRLANQLRTLLLRLEIRSTRTPCVKPGYPCRVYIAPEDTLKFIRVVDVRGASKKELIKTVFVETHKMIEKKRNPLPKSKWLSAVKIYSIYEKDPSTVRLCDIEVKIHHNFVASDVIVHNSEGMDIPSLNTLVMASPISSIEQSVGRIQRQKEEDRSCIPTVIDVWDQFSLFKNQGYRRQQFYKKNRYEIIEKMSLE